MCSGREIRDASVCRRRKPVCYLVSVLEGLAARAPQCLSLHHAPHLSSLRFELWCAKFGLWCLVFKKNQKNAGLTARPP